MRILTVRMKEIGGRGWALRGLVRSDMLIARAIDMEEQLSGSKESDEVVGKQRAKCTDRA